MSPYRHPRHPRARLPKPRSFELVLGDLWEQYVDGAIYDEWDRQDKEMKKTYENVVAKAHKAISDEIDNMILGDLMKEVTDISNWSPTYTGQKLDDTWNAADRIEPIGVVAPVRITSEVEITPDEMKSDLWQAIAHPILTKLRSSCQPQLASSNLPDIVLKTSALPATSTLRMSPSTYRQISTRISVIPTRNTFWPLVLTWYSLDDYPRPLTYGAILTNEPIHVMF